MGLPDIDNIPDTGAVFTLGRSRFADNIASHFFIRKDPIVNIACGDEHSAVVCQSGRLFVFGSNDWGQLGLGHKNHVSKPSCVKILKPEKVTHVSCGRAHTLICTGEQKIFACGSDQESQLGRGPQATGDSSSTPVPIYDCGLGGPKILEISAGSHHSLALISDGSVLAWGSNLEGQLGLPGTSGLVNKPTKLNLPEPIKQISAGYYHSAFLTATGNIYVCGEAESGKLGISLDFRTQVAPKQMQLSVPAAVVTCGGHHTLALGDDGEIYCTGSNANGQLGMGSEVSEIQTPKQLPRGPLEGEIIKKLVSGESHIAVVTESGKLFTCGDGRHGKLGLEENENNVHELTFALKYEELFVTNVACGGCHTILVGRRRHDENDDETSTQMNSHSLPPLKVPAASRMQSEEAEAVEKGENEPAEKDLPSSEPTNGVEKPESPKKPSEYEVPTSPNSKDSDDLEMNEVTDLKPSEQVVVAEIEGTEAPPEAVERPESSKSSVSKLLEEVTEEMLDETIVLEKPTSPPLPVPPPKPPRQKNGSVGSHESSKTPSIVSSRAGSGKMSNNNGSAKISNDDETKEVESPSKINENEDEIREGSQPKSAGSEKSLSNRSKADTAETMPLEANIQDKCLEEIDNLKEKIVQEVEEKIDLAADDADVVQSPAPRIGKMARLFKSIRQETENGTKTGSTTNLKAKSKTCNIL